MTKITILIPCFNELKTIEKVIEKVIKSEIPNKEIIIVDDFSTDGSREIIMNNIKKKVQKVLLHERNQGKGAAINTAKKFITGDIVLIQDADLEYNPNDYPKLIEPIIKKKTEVVYGSRVLGKNRYKSKNFSSIYRVFFNHLLTIFSNFINNQNLTDAHTCYKVFKKKVFDQIELKEKGFSFCPEVTTKLGKLGITIYEVPVEYNGRSYNEGKKISLKDGLFAILSLLKYRFFD